MVEKLEDGVEKHTIPMMLGPPSCVSTMLLNHGVPYQKMSTAQETKCRSFLNLTSVTMVRDSMQIGLLCH